MTIDWSTVRYFKEDEFRCSCCGASNMDESFIRMVDELRHKLGTPLKVTSGYRCPAYDAQVSKSVYKAHTTGKAADFGVSGEPADKLLALAYQMGFKGKGIHQRGDWGARFIHLDTIADRIWTY